jgi:hypothetical protein
VRPEARDADVGEVPLAPDEDDVARLQHGAEGGDLAGGDEGAVLREEPRVAHPVGDPRLDREPRGEAGALDGLERVLRRQDHAAPAAVAPEDAPVLEEGGRQCGRRRAPRALAQHAERGELGGPGRIEDAEPDAGIGAARQAELGDRLVQERLERGVPVEPIEQDEGEPVLGDEGCVADHEGLFARGRGKGVEPLVGAAQRVEGQRVVQEPLPGRPDRLTRLARGDARCPGRVSREEIWPRVDVSHDVAEAGPVDQDRRGVAGEARLASGRIEVGERRCHRTGCEPTEGETEPYGSQPCVAAAGFPGERSRSHVASCKSRLSVLMPKAKASVRSPAMTNATGFAPSRAKHCV